MRMSRRDLLTTSAVSVLAAAISIRANAAPLERVKSAPIPKVEPQIESNVDLGDLPIHEAQMIEYALDTVRYIWNFAPVQGTAFGYPMWLVGTTDELRTLIYEATVEQHDPVMWERVQLWLALGEMFDRKFGKNYGAKLTWMRLKQPLHGYNVIDYVTTGSPANLRSALKMLESVA